MLNWVASVITTCSITKTTSFLLKPQCSRLSQAKQWVTTYSGIGYWDLSKKQRDQSFYLAWFLHTFTCYPPGSTFSKSWLFLPSGRSPIVLESRAEVWALAVWLLAATSLRSQRPKSLRIPKNLPPMQLYDLQDLHPLLGSFLQPGSSSSFSQVSFFPTLLFGKPSDWPPLSSSIPSLWFLQSI